MLTPLSAHARWQDRIHEGVAFDLIEGLLAAGCCPLLEVRELM